jgi:hypothetical protein
MIEPIARARPDPGHFEDGRHVVLVVDAIEFGFEMRRNVHLHDVDMGHAVLPIAGLVIARLGESEGDHDRVCSGPAAALGRGMQKLRFGALLLICALLIGCAEAVQPSVGPPAPSAQPEPGGDDRGGMH